MTRSHTRRALLLTAASVIGGGGATAWAQPGGVSGRGGYGPTGHPADLPTTPGAKQPPLPPGAAAALARDRAAAARGEEVPMPVYDEATGGMKRRADGSLAMSTDPDLQPAPACARHPRGCGN